MQIHTSGMYPCTHTSTHALAREMGGGRGEGRGERGGEGDQEGERETPQRHRKSKGLPSVINIYVP